MKKILLINLFIYLFAPFYVSAHPGRTDSLGCHTCRTNCASWGLGTGEYHCHQAKSLPQPEEPIKSTYGTNGTGYTTPAPEYQAPKSASLPTNTTNQNNLENQIKDKVNNEKANYIKNHHLFREKLITQLEKEFDKNDLIGFYVYTLLTDVNK